MRVASTNVALLGLATAALLMGCPAAPGDLCDQGACGTADGSANDDSGDAMGSDASGADGALDGVSADASDGGADSADAPGDTGMICDGGGIACNGACVDPNSPLHCGSCSNVCPVPTNGSATCAMPNCGIQCNTNFHACIGACMPDSDEPSADACVIGDAFGVFVAPTGSDSNACTKAAPCKTIGKGLTAGHAAGKRVYVCEGTYDEQLVVDATLDGAKVFGGFACGTWTYDVNKKPIVAPSAVGYALSITGLTTGASFSDFQFQSADATTAGTSSIAVFASANGSSNLSFKRVNVTAGNGANGAPGTLSSYTYPSTTTLRGNPGSGATGGAANVVVCPGGLSTTGGKGGDAAAVAGDPGLPALGGGAAGTSAACVGFNTGGGNGASAGAAANGAGASNLGTLSAGGWAPTLGTVGTSGGPGQGGGGGGGVSPGGGGGGGAGGCGGNGGGGGGGGGASVPIAAFNSAINLVACTLVSKRAGSGGSGVSGQAGQAQGGNGGLPDANGGCSGGRGGAGGLGGAGGGGAGGVSAGILYKGSAPTLDSQTMSSFVQGQKGTKGTGGAPGTNDGIDGANGVTLAAP